MLTGRASRRLGELVEFIAVGGADDQDVHAGVDRPGLAVVPGS